MLQSTAVLQHITAVLQLFSSREKRARANSAWKYYWCLYERRYGSFLGAITGAIVQSLLLLPVPFIVGYLIDRALPAHSKKLVLLAGAGIFASLSAYALFTLVTRHYAAKANAAAVCRLRRELLAHWFRLSRSYLSGADHGKLHATLIQDSDRVAQMGTILIEQFLPASLTCLALCVFLFWVDFRGLLVLLAIAPLLLLSIRGWEKRVKQSVREFRRTGKDFSHAAIRFLRSFDLIRQRGVDDYEFGQQTKLVEQLHSATLQMSHATALYNCAQSIIIAFAVMLVLAFSGIAVVTGRMTIGQLLALYAGFALLRDRLYTALQSVPQLIAGNESLVAIWQMLQIDDCNPYEGTLQLQFEGHVEFKDVSFSYAEAESVKNIDLVLRPGRSTAITGPNAAGKTTLVYLLLGFYRPNCGTITIDGAPIDEIDLPHFRRQIGMVPQDPLIPSGSILEIIRYGFPQASRAEIETAARASGLHDFIAELSDGYDTQVGEEGIKLSGGQRQRLAIARALLGQPRLLILDEPTNHLDPATVGRLMERLQELPSRPAMLLITHDVEVARLTDYAYVINSGRVVSEGASCEILCNELLPEHFIAYSDLQKQFKIPDSGSNRIPDSKFEIDRKLSVVSEPRAIATESMLD